MSSSAYVKFVFCNNLKFEAIPHDIPLNAERLEVSFNNIRNVTYIPELPLLSTLDLNFNDIEHMSWPALRVLPCLKYLTLGHNRLIHVKLDTVITDLPKLTFVDFSYNELVSVSPYEFGLPQVTNAIIHHNPYNCGCDMAWLIAKMACLESLIRSLIETFS
ncbi:leucine-rich repeat and fibronectin type III domain-containing protein 1-like [Branchiostoma floridae x Branchiostoma japonicum]